METLNSPLDEFSPSGDDQIAIEKPRIFGKVSEGTRNITFTQIED
jgi:hypothetical protein